MMKRFMLAAAVLAGAVSAAPAQSPGAVTFQQVGSTADLHTTKSRAYWANMLKLQQAATGLKAIATAARGSGRAVAEEPRPATVSSGPAPSAVWAAGWTQSRPGRGR